MALQTPEDARARRFRAQNSDAAQKWQQDSRAMLFELLKLSDLVKKTGGRSSAAADLPLDPKVLSESRESAYIRYELEFNSTPARRIKAIATVPAAGESGERSRNGERYPAVVCIHGHGGNAAVVYDAKSIYGGFARVLADRGFVTVSTDVGQHEVREAGRTLIGERLWDLIRCVDYLCSRDDVDAARIGCAGLSLGGEMAMWLAAMDTRVQACVSSGFLTTVANMRDRHCPCWDFPGLTQNFDFAEIYTLIAPRRLACQIGEQERTGGGFPVSIARPAMEEIRANYRVFGQEDLAVLQIHAGGHVFETRAGVEFLERALR